MPIETGYERQARPGGAATAPVQAGADAFGAGVGAAIEQTGDVLHRANIQAYHVERQLQGDQDLSAFNAQFARVRADNAKAQVDLQTGAAAGGAGYHAAVTGQIAPQGEQLLGQIRDPEVRRRAQQQWDGYAAEQDTRAYAWQAGAAAAKTVGDAQQAAQLGANNVLTGADTAYADETGHWHDYVHGLSGIDEDARDKLLRHGDGQLAVAQIGKLRGTSPTAALAAIDAGAFNSTLSPEQLEQARRGAEVDLRREQAQTRATADQAREQAVKGADLTAGQYRQGRATFDQWQELSRTYAANGADEKAQTARFEADKIGGAERYRGADPTTRDARIAELSAMPTRTPQQGAELAGLRDQSGYVASLPAIGRYTYATGRAVAPLDWSDPASIHQRQAVVAAAQARFGGVPDFLLPGEEAPLKQLIGGNADQKIEAAHAIMQAGPSAGALLDRVAGGHDDFRAAATLAALGDGGERMRLAMQGPDALKANAGLLKTPVDPVLKRPIGPSADDVWKSYAPALALLPEGYRRDLRANATNIYAANAGRAGWSEFHAAEMPRALRFALGGGKQAGEDAGGVGAWAGQPVVLPREMSQRAFDATLSRATPDQWGAASTRGVAWVGDVKGGRAMTTGEARALVPVMTGDGLYALRTGNGYATTRDGTMYQFDIRKMR